MAAYVRVFLEHPSYIKCVILNVMWLSGRILDTKDCGFEAHRRHCVVSLSKTHLALLSTGSAQGDLSQHNWKIVDMDVKKQIKQTILK